MSLMRVSMEVPNSACNFFFKPIITDQLFGPENHLSSETLAKLLGLTFSNNLDFNVCEDLMSSFWVIFRPSSHAQKRAVLVAKPSLR